MAVKPLSLEKIRDDAGKRSSAMQTGIVDATGDVYRLADAVERASIERDQARELVGRLAEIVEDLLAQTVNDKANDVVAFHSHDPEVIRARAALKEAKAILA